MYVTPRPKASSDPYYALRLGLTGALAYLAVALLNPALPPIIAALPIGLIAAQREAFNAGKAIAGPIVMILLVYIMTVFVELLRPMPLVYITAMWFTYFLGFRMVLNTGAQAGMLIIIVAVLISVMGMHGTAIVETMRNGFIQAALVSLVIAPLVYTVFPAKTQKQHVDTPTPSTGNNLVGAAIRASVLLGLSFWLYAVMKPSDMMMAVIAAMVLVFPSRHAVLFEAKQRILATFYGSALGLVVLMVYTFTAYLPILLGLIFLGGYWLGQGMLFGKQPSMVYQYAFSVAMALIAGSLSTQDPGYATFTRIVLTLAGALTATSAVALLDAITNWRGESAVPEKSH